MEMKFGILEQYPLPWKVQGVIILAANNTPITGDADIKLLEFIVDSVNRFSVSESTKKDLISIIDQPCQCAKCHWFGVVWNCESDEETGDLLCPKCLVAIEVTV